MDTTSDLAKEVLVIIFRAFPGDFVLIGGGALHWIFHSPRLSADIDLKPTHPGDENLVQRIADTLNSKLPPLAPSGSRVVCEANQAAQAVRILIDGRPALRVELASLAPVAGNEKHLLQSDSLQSEIIVTPDIHQLLFAKAAALLKRPHVKGRDVFDIWFLQGRQAKLDGPAFSDWLTWEEIEASDIEDCLKQITPSRLKSDLSRFLPESVHHALAEADYQPLINAARKLLEPFL